LLAPSHCGHQPPKGGPPPSDPLAPWDWRGHIAKLVPRQADWAIHHQCLPTLSFQPTPLTHIPLATTLHPTHTQHPSPQPTPPHPSSPSTPALSSVGTVPDTTLSLHRPQSTYYINYLPGHQGYCVPHSTPRTGGLRPTPFNPWTLLGHPLLTMPQAGFVGCQTSTPPAGSFCQALSSTHAGHTGGLVSGNPPLTFALVVCLCKDHDTISAQPSSLHPAVIWLAGPLLLYE
jgi:hypothetical protein